MSTSLRICRTVLRITVLLCCWLQTQHNVFAGNVTVPDTDPSIVYSPVESWSPSSKLCSTCLNPNISMPYHEGINSALGPGPTVVSTSSTGIPTAPPLPPPPSPTSSPDFAESSPNSAVTIPNSVVTSQGGSPTVPSSSSSPSPTDDGDGGSHHGPDKDRDSADTPVTLSYNFTGTAIYLFSIQPPTEVPVGVAPTYTKLYFTLDNQFVGNFSPTETSTDFMPNTNVLSLDGLSNQPHQLVVTVGYNSVFLFDHLIYTNGSAAAVAAPQTTAKSDKKNVATFAGAIGGSVGVLSLFSLGIAISIIRRRVLAARRDRLDSEANSTSDAPSMSGPMPFIPRFFPDTIIPQDPPTYNDALSSTNHNNAPSVLASLASSVYSSRQRSYADIPPDSPPPPLDELPPPPFPVALTSAPVGDVTTPSISDGRNSTNATSPHEDTPLLQSSDSDGGDSRPRSRTSTRSLELSENFETNLHHQEPEEDDTS